MIRDVTREPTSAYTADRTAALAGVPQSTVHYWDRTGVLQPSVSPDKVKLWSFADLMGLRMIAWLRRIKVTDAGHEIPASTMPAIRRALQQLKNIDIVPWTAKDEHPHILVDPNGHVVIRDSAGQHVKPVGTRGVLQRLFPDVIDLVAPFGEGGISGPDLLRPRPRLRIVPGKLAGAPHIEDTRLETEAIHALAVRGFQPEKIQKLYPFADLESINDAIALESQLHRAA